MYTDLLHFFELLSDVDNAILPGNIVDERDHWPISEPLEDLDLIINRIKSNKAPGLGRINSKLLKYGPETIK